MTTIVLQVKHGDDDADETAGGVVSLSHVGAVIDTIGQFWANRWYNVPIPVGATITAATVDAWFFDDVDDEPNHTMYFEAADSAAAFTTGANDLSARSRTTGVAWNNADLGIGAGGGFATSPDMAADLQAVIDRAGWAFGNSLAWLITPATADTGRDAGFQGWNSSSAKAHKLTVTFTPPAGWGIGQQAMLMGVG